MNRLFATRVCAAFAALTFYLLAAPAMAGGLSVSPVVLSIEGRDRVATFELQNVGMEPRTVTLTALSWQQDAEGGGASITDRTRDVIVTPGQVTVVPGQSRLVRVGLRRALPEDRQLTYRVLVEQISEPDREAASGGLKFLINYSLPVFVEARKPTFARAEWYWDGQRQQLLCSNEGGTRALRFNSVELVPARGEKPLWSGHASTVLAGYRRLWPVQGLPATLPARAQIKVFDIEKNEYVYYPLRVR